MKVYRIVFESQFQYLLFEDKALSDPTIFPFDCRPMASTWSPKPVFSYEPLLQAGDFWSLSGRSAAMVLAPQAIDVLTGILAHAGELLQLPFNGQVFKVVNITQCVDCLDQGRVEWVYGRSTGKPIRIAKYVFIEDRLPEASIFKIPETAKAEILCYEGVKDAADEFKSVVELSGLRGIAFKELWSSDDQGTLAH